MAEQSATRRTVLIAGAANIFVGVIKLVAGILVGSSAMLAEAAHSAADTLNQVFLLASLRQSARPADAKHPFGYGQERYFWSLLAAFGIFIAGAGFSIFEGLLALGHTSNESPLLAYLVLAAAALAEGTSLVRVLVQYRAEARRSHTEMLDQVRSSPDTTVRTALFEDSAAMVGLALAAFGLALRQVTGSPVWDGAASIAIGCLLIVVAVRLGMDNKEYLIGRAARPEDTGDHPERDRADTRRGQGRRPAHHVPGAGPSDRGGAGWTSAATSARTGPRRSPTRSTSGSPNGSPRRPHVFLDPDPEVPGRPSAREAAESSDRR